MGAVIYNWWGRVSEVYYLVCSCSSTKTIYIVTSFSVFSRMRTMVVLITWSLVVMCVSFLLFRSDFDLLYYYSESFLIFRSVYSFD